MRSQPFKYLAPFLIVLATCWTSTAYSQASLSGKIYDGETETTLEGVSVRNKTRHTGELSDRYGFYSISLAKGDSVEFYMVGYGRFYVIGDGTIAQKKQVFLHVEKFNLPEVTVLAHKNSKRDSLLNRQENAAIFGYHRPSAATAIVGSIFHPISGMEYLANSAKRKRLRNFQTHLIGDEHERYIDSRYTRQAIIDITGLEGDELEEFRRLYRPSYETVLTFTEYDILEFIKTSYKDYVHFKKMQRDTAGHKPELKAKSDSVK